MDQSLREAWERFVDQSYTLEDLLLILDSVKEDNRVLEFHAVDDKVWKDAISKIEPLTKSKEKKYRRKATQLLEQDECKHGQRQKQLNSRRKTYIRKTLYMAALVLCLLIPATYFYLNNRIIDSDVQLVEKKSRTGEIISFILPDATKVTLNAGSRLVYSESFTDAERSVELHGEALFEVTADPANPFIVKNENMNVRVLGTVFGVKAYADDSLETVTVVSGKVEVDCVVGKVLLEKNQQVKINNDEGYYEKIIIDANKYASWTDGSLYFNLMPIEEVINMLKRYYPEAVIELVDDDYTNLISGEHENESLDNVLTSIVYSTGLKCKQLGGKYIIYSEKCPLDIQ